MTHTFDSEVSLHTFVKFVIYRAHEVITLKVAEMK